MAGIDWVHEDCQEWGAYMRHKVKSWPSKNMAWKMWREQGATSSGRVGEREPLGALAIFHPSNRRVSELHRVWREMPDERLSMVMLACYVIRGGHQKQADWLGETVRQMYQLRENLHYYLAGRLDRPR